MCIRDRENLAFCQAAVGKEREGHATMLEALAIYRQLAEDGTPASSAQLAQAFAYLSGQENALGMSAEALQSAEVAVDLFGTVDGDLGRLQRLGGHTLSLIHI